MALDSRKCQSSRLLGEGTGCSCMIVSYIMGIIIKSPKRLISNLASLVAIGHCGGTYLTVLVCHMILQDHLIKGSNKFIGGTCSR